jgi:hypothetical protein
LSFPTFAWSRVPETSAYCVIKIVITGFNTDIEHDGVVYHVQTEDKGLDSPLILSLVYSGGAILASKRSRYEDLIATGFNEEVLTKRLKRQHRLICAAINAGRLEDLKRMSARSEEAVTLAAPIVTPTPEVAAVNEAGAREAAAAEARAVTEDPAVEEASVVGDDTLEEAVTPRKRRRARAKEAKESAYTVYDPRRHSPLGELAAPETGLVITVLDEDEFQAGESFTIRILLEDRSEKKAKPIGGVPVSVKILGTTFRPQIYSVKTERDGVAVFATTMPSFTSGRAAVLIRAVVKEQTVEVRRVIHPAK